MLSFSATMMVMKKVKIKDQNDNAKYKNARNIVDFNVYSFSIFICHFSF